MKIKKKKKLYFYSNMNENDIPNAPKDLENLTSLEYL